MPTIRATVIVGFLPRPRPAIGGEPVLRKLILLLALVLQFHTEIAVSGPAPDSSGCNAEETLTRLEESYRRQGPMMFAFRQRTVSAVFGDERAQEGKAWLDPAGQFRVEVSGETFLFRADTLWHYVPAYRQVTVRVLDSNSRAGLPPDFVWDLRQNFLPVDCRLDTLEGRSYFCVRAVARTSSAAIQRLKVWIDPQSLMVEQAEYTDYNDDRVNLRFLQMKKDHGAPNRRYILELPDSVEVVTLPAKKRQQNSPAPR